MSADIRTTCIFKGTKEQIKAMLTALLDFDSEIEFEDAYADDIDDFLAKIKNRKLEIELAGPYGKYYLPEIKILEHIADASPEAEFQISIGGFITGGEAHRQGCLCDGELKIYTTVLSDYNDNTGYEKVTIYSPITHTYGECNEE